jgi:hypothetical protein
MSEGEDAQRPMLRYDAECRDEIRAVRRLVHLADGWQHETMHFDRQRTSKDEKYGNYETTDR